MTLYTQAKAEYMLDKVFKAYDVRGIVGEHLNSDIAFAVGAAFADEVNPENGIIIGHDMRSSSPIFANAFASGAAERGINVTIMGLCSTDANYFASGLYNAETAMFTASHNPAEYNGIKMCRKGAKAISSETGLQEIKRRTLDYMVNGVKPKEKQGVISHKDLLTEYVMFLRKLVHLEKAKPLKIVIDAANGMGGFTSPAVFGTEAGLEALPFEIIPMYFELDGTFPNHEANPLDLKNLEDLRKRVVEEKADLGLAFDGDADRCFVVDEKGEPVTASTVAAIVAKREILKAQNENPSSKPKVLYSLTCSKKMPQLIKDLNAEPVRVRVGHSFAKEEMAKTGAIFGGEHSGHFYFKSLWGADSGMLAALHVIAEVSDTGKTMSELSESYNPYYSSGEINSTVSDPKASTANVLEAIGNNDVDYLDGVFISSGYDTDTFWWVSLRSSNTEPLLRLNVESNSLETMEKIRDQILSIINL